MRSITVLIVGQVRNQHVFLRSIDNLAPLCAQGLVDQVILATWTEELRRIEALAPRLAGRNGAASGLLAADFCTA